MQHRVAKTERARLIIEWILNNEELLSAANTLRLLLHIKGVAVAGEVTLLPDAKK